MNRRDFVARGTALAAASVLAPAQLLSQPRRGDACGGPPAGVQLFTVREALGRDPRGALRSLHEIGIVEAELFGLNGPESSTLFGLPARDLKRAFDDSGRVVYTNATLRTMRENEATTRNPLPSGRAIKRRQLLLPRSSAP